MATNEQAQQINMPELNYSEEQFMSSIIRMSNDQLSTAQKWQGSEPQ